MEEIKVILEMVASLPNAAMWVLVGFLFYKLSLMASTVALLRLFIIRGFDWLGKPRCIEMTLDSVCLTKDVEMGLRAELARLSRTGYIYMSDVVKLREALDAVLKAK